MAELKRQFIGAKIDSDSDERFVSNGNYVDAVNVDVLATEGGDSGVVRNKKGNTPEIKKSNVLNWTEGINDPFGLGDGAVSVGILKHTPTDTIYNFISSDNVNTILEFNAVTGIVTPILTDTNNILGWNSDTLITGLQILEDTLGWVVEDLDPCAISISEFKTYTTSPNTTTQINGSDFNIEDITMTRIAPKSAPDMVLSKSLRTLPTNTTTSYNFTDAALNNGSLSNAIDIGATVSLTFPTLTGFVVGDKITLKAQAQDDDEFEAFYEVNLVIQSATLSASSITAEVISISQEIEDNILTWEVDLIDSKPLFELEFPRFAYRWKYKDEQYSTFSPFTQVAFLPDTFLYNSQEGHNVGMTNNVRKVTLSGFDTPPNRAAKLDILYKEARSASVYVVETLDIDKTSYEITSELIWKLTESNQLLRPFDALPKSAKALEVIGNRFVLGNYKQGYNLDEEEVVFDKAAVVSSQVAEVNEPERSIKSLRTYQAAISYMDSLGRETPLFSNKKGVLKTNLEDAPTANKVELKMGGVAPQFATHFKYYLKDIANEYYNLAADRLYQTEDKLATWISFPSSERNKINQETYLIAKKRHDVDIPVVDSNNRFKVVAIENEPPTEISTRKEIVVNSQIFFDSNFGDGKKKITKTVGATPVLNSKTFLIASDTSKDSKGCTSILTNELTKGAFIRFVAGASKSKYYQLSSVLKSKDTNPDTYYGLNDSSGVHLRVNITEAFGEDINFLYTDPASDTSPMVNEQVTMEVSTPQPLANQEQFSGRFFVKLASNTVLNNVFSQGEAYTTLNAAVCYDGGYINGDVNFKIHAGGAYPKLDYSTSGASGGLDIDKNPSWANDNSDTIYDIVFERRHKLPIDNSLIAAITTVGTKLRFSNHSTVYTVAQTKSRRVGYRDYDYTRYWTLFDKPLTATVSPRVTGQDVTVEIVGFDDAIAFTSKNPAIFETEPVEAVDLDLYYEASEAFPIAEYTDTKVLDYYNCFSFGNGVESNRIRDDYNQTLIDKGPKVSTVLDKPYLEEHAPNDMIWSGLYNSNSDVNNLNQFILAEKITKQINPIYGSIQKLHARDTDLIVFCEDKVVQVLANKDALYNADGSTNITASNNVLGDSRPYVGEFGISTNPESFASYGFRAYFADKRRGVVLRLSRDGITPIIDGYEDKLEEILGNNNKVVGSFDDELGTYNLTVGGKTHLFSEKSGGFVSTWTLNPETAITLNNVYYTTKDGVLWAHTDEVNRNDWYGLGVRSSSITVVFNDAPSSIKKFKTVSYEGDDGWIADVIETDQQSGRVLTWAEKEGKFYNHIKGLETTWDNSAQTGTLDTKEFHVQGVGLLDSISGDTERTTYTIDIFDDPSDH